MFHNYILDNSIFPFYLLSDIEISNMFCDLTGEINLSSKDKGGIKHDLFSNELPFYSCSDYAVMYECMSANTKLLEMFENNGFSQKYINIIEGYTIKHFDYKYYNEDKFNFMSTKNHSDVLKVYRQDFT